MSRKLILIMDDDRFVRKTIGKTLTDAGFEVLHAKDGREGLALMENRKPAMVLLDIQMPVMDGFKTLSVIRNTGEFEHIPVILFTTFDRENLKIRGLELGADDYMPKPVKGPEIIARINAALRRSGTVDKKEETLHGNLSNMGLSDIMQSLHQGSKTAGLFIDGIDAELFIRDGELIHVRQGKFTGYSALLRIFLKESGDFSVRFNEPSEVISDYPETMVSSLMRVSRDVDEILDTIDHLGLKTGLLRISDDVHTAFPDIEDVRKEFPRTFLDTIVLMKGHPVNNMKILIQALENGMVIRNNISSE